MAADLARKTGCSEAEATVYLLCGLVPDCPWLEAWIRTFPSQRRPAFVITVGSPAVSAEQVRSFYLAVREEVARTSLGGAQHMQARRAWTYELLEFVEQRRRDKLPWATIYEGWNATHAEHRYASLPGMRRSYYEARKKPPRHDDGGGPRPIFAPNVYRPRRPT